jgi:hypothetical protein
VGNVLHLGIGTEYAEENARVVPAGSERRDETNVRVRERQVKQLPLAGRFGLSGS